MAADGEEELGGGAARTTAAREDQGTDADESGAAKGHTTPLLIKTLQKHHNRMIESSQEVEDEEDLSARETTKGKWAELTKLVRGFFGSRQPTARWPIIMNAGNW